MTFSLTIQTADDLAAEARAEAAAAVNAAVRARIEAEAQARGYDSAAQFASYTASTVPDWAAEARAFVAWRDACWQAVFALPPGTDRVSLPPAP